MAGRSVPSALLPWGLSMLGVDESSGGLMPVAGDASTRRYFRFVHGGVSYVLAEAPPASENNEAFVRVHINLLAVPGAKLEDIRVAKSHLVLLPQCGEFLRKHNIIGGVSPDNARAARDVAEAGDIHTAALASELAGEIYGLDVLERKIEDHGDNTTRFLIMSREPDRSRRGAHGMITSFVFQVRNIPAALYKGMGGFATNGINMTKLESYMVDGSFTATQFYADIEGHPDDANVQLAMDELDYFTTNVEILGVYPADNGRY